VTAPTLDLLIAQEHDPSRRVVLRDATVLTGRAGDGPVRGDLLLVGSRIAALGTVDATGPGLESAVVVDLDGAIVMPGLIDAHLHAWEGQLRGMAPDADFDTYLDLAHRNLAPHYRPEDSHIGNLATALACLDAGITTIIDNSHNTRSHEHGVAAVDGLLASGIRAVHAAGAPLFGTWDLPLGDHLDKLATHLSGAGDLLTLRLMEGGPTLENWRVAAERGLWVSTEVIDAEWLAAVAGPHATDLARAGHTFNHCVDLHPEAWQFIVDAGIQVNVCPRSDSHFGVGPAYPAVDEARAVGLLPGLSSDNELSYSIDMFTEMRVLLHQQRARHHQARRTGDQTIARLSAAEALEMATLGGAHNAGLGARTGSLEVDKEADLVILDPVGSGVVPPADPVAAAVLFAHPGTVAGVFVGGRVRKWDGALVGVDTAAVRSAAERSRRRLVSAAL